MSSNNIKCNTTLNAKDTVLVCNALLAHGIAWNCTKSFDSDYQALKQFSTQLLALDINCFQGDSVRPLFQWARLPGSLTDEETSQRPTVKTERATTPGGVALQGSEHRQ